MQSTTINTATRGYVPPAVAESPSKKELSVWDRIQDFFEHNVVERTSEKYGDYVVNKRMYAAAAGATAVGGVLGYAKGAENQKNDVVTTETVMRDVMKSVKVGQRTVTGGYRYHYSGGDWKYGYDPLYVHTEPVYKSVPTGEKVPELKTYHTANYPYTAIEGLVAGTLVGMAFGVAALVAARIIAVIKDQA